MNTLEQEAALVRKAQRGDPDAYAALLEAHRGVIIKWTHAFAGDYARHNHAQDLESEGLYAFARTLAKFDVSRGNRFVTVLRFAVRRYVLEYLQRETRLRRGSAEPAGPPIVSMESTMDERGDREEFFPVPDGGARAVPHAQVDMAWSASVLVSSGWTTDDAARYGADAHERLAQSMAVLSPQARHLMNLRYVMGWSLERIMAQGYVKPMTRSRVERDLGRALRSLREAMGQS